MGNDAGRRSGADRGPVPGSNGSDGTAPEPALHVARVGRDGNAGGARTIRTWAGPGGPGGYLVVELRGMDSAAIRLRACGVCAGVRQSGIPIA